MKVDRYDYAIKRGLVKAERDGTIYKRHADGSFRKVKQRKDPDKYEVINVIINGISKPLVAHRIVAKTFIPNPESKPQVNHIDGNKSNNNVNNLEWCTAKENAYHAIYTLAPKCPDCGKSTRTSNGICPICRTKRYKRQKEKQRKELVQAMSKLETKKNMNLSERDKMIISLRKKGHTYQRIGDELGISKQRVQQIIKNIKYKIEKERIGLLRLVELSEGKRQVLAEGYLQDIVQYLQDNEYLYSWVNDEIDPNTGPIELPDLSDIETLRDLEYELSKTDLGWWALEVKKV